MLPIELFKIEQEYGHGFGTLYGPANQAGEGVSICGEAPPEGPLESAFIDKQEKLGDLINTASGALVLSERAAEFVKQYRIQEGTRFFPVEAVGRGGRTVASLIAVWFPKLLPILDMQQSAFEYAVAAPRVPVHAIRRVARSGAAEGLDLLDARYVQIVCSARLKAAIEAAGLKNFYFSPIYTSEECPMGSAEGETR